MPGPISIYDVPKSPDFVSYRRTQGDIIPPSQVYETGQLAWTSINAEHFGHILEHLLDRHRLSENDDLCNFHEIVSAVLSELSGARRHDPIQR